MADDVKPIKNWFDQGGRAYASFRPEYPPELPKFLADCAPDKSMAVDVGCGSGQLTRPLADHFNAVAGLDASEDQIANAKAHERIRYLCAPAEKLPLPDRSASLVTAAQAAHWFDLAAFYREVRRIAVEGAAVALASYGVLQLDQDDLQERFSRFYRNEIGPYWPPERRLVDTGYADISFPFHERPAPEMGIERAWQLAEFLGYVSTWSAVRQVNQAGRGDILDAFVHEFSAVWGDTATKRAIFWPIALRVGTV